MGKRLLKVRPRGLTHVRFPGSLVVISASVRTAEGRLALGCCPNSGGWRAGGLPSPRVLPARHTEEGSPALVGGCQPTALEPAWKEKGKRRSLASAAASEELRPSPACGHPSPGFLCRLLSSPTGTHAGLCELQAFNFGWILRSSVSRWHFCSLPHLTAGGHRKPAFQSPSLYMHLTL